MKDRRKNFHARPEHEKEFIRYYLKWHLIGLVIVLVLFPLLAFISK